MADGAERGAGSCPAHTIYVRPSRTLLAESWYWPESWHGAFEQMEGRLGRMVAVCVLGGLPVTQRRVNMRVPAGHVGFAIKRWGTSIYISVSEFEGPIVPGPLGRACQPRAAEGLVLGLRGSTEGFTIVTFCGPQLPVLADDGVQLQNVVDQTMR